MFARGRPHFWYLSAWFCVAVSGFPGLSGYSAAQGTSLPTGALAAPGEQPPPTTYRYNYDPERVPTGPPPAAVAGPYTFNDPRGNFGAWATPFTRMPAGDATARLGQTDLTLRVALTGEYVDNVNLSATDPRSDVIASVTPVLYARRPLGDMHQVGVQTGLRLAQYFERSDLTTSDPFFGADAMFGFNNLTLSISDYFVRSSDPSQSYFLVNEEKVVRYNNNFTAAVSREFGKLGGSLGYVRTDQEYESEQYASMDSTSNGGFGRLTLPLSPSVRSFVAYEHVDREYRVDTRPDYTSDDVRVGVQDQLTEFISGSVNGGVMFREYGPGSNRRDQDSLSEFVFSASLRHELREGTVQSVYFNKSPSDNPEGNFFDRWTAGWRLSHLLRSELMVSTGLAYSNVSSSEENGEKAEIWSAMAGGSYPVAKNANLGLSYRYQTRDSDSEGRSYDQNRVTLSLSVFF